MAQLNIAIAIAGVDQGANSLLNSVTGGLGSLAKMAQDSVSVAMGGMLKDAFSAAGEAAIGFFKDALAAEQQQVSLTQTLKTAGEVFGGTVGDVNRLAKQFRDLAGGSDETVVAIEQIGIKAGTVSKEQMPDFIQRTLDLGAVMGDTSMAATLLARAQDDPAGAFLKVERATGVYDVALKKQIDSAVKAGDTAKATALLLDFVADKTGGQAAAAANTLSGRWEILQNHLMDAGKGIMESLLPAVEALFDTYITPNIPVIEAFAGKIGDLITSVTKGKDPIDDIRNALVAMLPTTLITGINNLGSAFKALTGGHATEFFSWITEAAKSFGLFWVQVQPQINAFIASLIAWVQSQIPVVVAALQTWGAAFVAWISPMIPPFLAQLGVLLGTAVGWLLSTGIPMLVTATGQLISQLVAGIVSGAPAASAGGQTLVGAFVQGFLTGLAPFGPRIAQIVTDATQTVNLLLTIAWAAITEVPKRSWLTIALSATIAWTGITTALQTAWDNILIAIGTWFIGLIATWQSNWDMFDTIITTIWDNIKKTVSDAIDSVKKSIQPLLDMIANVQSGIANIHMPTIDLPHFANGADFVVPPGFPNDSFPMRVQSGEHVTVTPAGQSADGGSLTINVDARGSSLSAAQIQNAVQQALAAAGYRADGRLRMGVS